MSSTSIWWSVFFTGAKPTPQLPITTVVTPWCELGDMREAQVAWPS